MVHLLGAWRQLLHHPPTQDAQRLLPTLSRECQPQLVQDNAGPQDRWARGGTGTSVELCMGLLLEPFPGVYGTNRPTSATPAGQLWPRVPRVDKMYLRAS